MYLWKASWENNAYLFLNEYWNTFVTIATHKVELKVAFIGIPKV